MGGKYPSELWLPPPGDITIGAVSLRLVGRPLTIVLEWRSAEGVGKDGRDEALNACESEPDPSCGSTLLSPMDVERRGFLGIIVGSNGSVS